MNKKEFFSKYGNELVVANKDNAVDGDYLFLHPEEISRVKEFDTELYQIVSVHETEGEDFIDIGEIDYGTQPYKYGYFVIKKK
jgi:hypothetical protein